MWRASAFPLAAAAASGNMNGKYSLASGKDQDVPFNDDYASKGHEYFDVWSPEIATHYGEVFWTDMGAMKIPDEIVQRFKGKAIAITGYEMDQVMVSPTGQPGVNPEADVSVPFNWAYNHHFEVHMLGSDSEVREVPCGPTDIHCVGTHFVAFDTPAAAQRRDTSIPTNQYFSEGNGGESRKSYHGYPNGYAQLVDQPTGWRATPMQIDTRNRDCGVGPEHVTNCTTFVPGPEPKQARYGRGIPKDTAYSGILECPCTEGFGGDPIFYPEAGTKVVEHDYALRSSGSCSDQVVSAPACFRAVQTLGINATSFENKAVSDAKLPPACSVIMESDGSATVYYNDAGEASCDAGVMKRVGEATSPINVTLALELDVLKTPGMATITLTGPADVWFAVGLKATQMLDQPYTFIVNDTDVTEMKLGGCENEGKHCDGPVLKSSVAVVSNTVAGGVRTVVVTRGLVGLTKDHYTFDLTDQTMPLITAVGKSMTFAYHSVHGLAEISLTSLGFPTCLCDLGAHGKICETNGSNCGHEFNTGRCVHDGPLWAQKNPTCNTATYSGGLTCCGHKRFMLDLAQREESQQRDILRYHFKFRWWFQEYVPASASSTNRPSHYNLDRVYYQTEAHATEYDVPPAFPLPGLPVVGYPDWPVGKMTPGTSCTGTCPDGDDCECEHTITYEWSISNTRIVYAGGHCHAPSCLSLNLYINNSGSLELFCAQVPKYGKGNVSTDRFDEKDYLALPPCLWSDDPKEGLNPTTWLKPGTRLVSIKKNRNTHTGHFGEMASWQMRGVHFETPALSSPLVV